MAGLAEITLEEHEVCCRRGEINSCDTFSSGDVLSKSAENKGHCHVTPGTKLRVEHVATQTQMIHLFCQEAKSTEHVKQLLSSHAFVSHWTCSRFVNSTSARCASVSNLFRSGKGRERCHSPRFGTSCRVLKTHTCDVFGAWSGR